PAAAARATCSVALRSTPVPGPCSPKARRATIWPQRAANSRISRRSWGDKGWRGMARPALGLWGSGRRRSTRVVSQTPLPGKAVHGLSGEHAEEIVPPPSPSPHRHALAEVPPMDTLYPCCAGLDVHKGTVVACVRKALGGGRVHQEVRTFRTET